MNVNGNFVEFSNMEGSGKRVLGCLVDSMTGLMTFCSAAEVFSERAIGVLLTGMEKGRADGMKSIKSQCCILFSQHLPLQEGSVIIPPILICRQI